MPGDSAELRSWILFQQQQQQLHGVTTGWNRLEYLIVWKLAAGPNVGLSSNGCAAHVSLFWWASHV